MQICLQTILENVSDLIIQNIKNLLKLSAILKIFIFMQFLKIIIKFIITTKQI